jgi:hypothetical protein
MRTGRENLQINAAEVYSVEPRSAIFFFFLRLIIPESSSKVKKKRKKEGV